MNEIKIEYDGGFPNLCRGKLTVEVDGKRWNFADFSLETGGSVWFDENWGDHVEDGPWDVGEWPKDFPEEAKGSVIAAINSTIPHGCCGGCV